MALLPSFFNTGSPALFNEPWNWRSWGTPLNSLDLFDPFDELDRDLSRSFHWFLKPEFLRNQLPLFPRVPQKYRITVDCSGFEPSSIKTDLNDKDKRLVVTAHEEYKGEGNDDFTLKQLKKTYQLPPNSITDQMVSFMSNGQLVIEVPLMETDTQRATDLFPQIVDVEGGKKQVMMKFNVPENIDPKKVSVSIKGHDIVLRAEDQLKRPDGVTRTHYYQRTTLPEHAQLDQIRCVQDNNQVTVTAPLGEGTKQLYRKVPIETIQHGGQQQQQQQQQKIMGQHQQGLTQIQPQGRKEK